MEKFTDLKGVAWQERRGGGVVLLMGGEVDTPMHTMPTIIALIFSNFTTFQHRSEQPPIKQNLISSIKKLLGAVATRVADCNKEILRQV